MYNPRLYPFGCKNPSYGDMKAFKDGVLIAGREVNDEKNYNYLRQQWAAGNYKVYFKHNGWQAAEVRDFSFKAHLPFELTDIKVTSFSSYQESTDFVGDAEFSNALSWPLTQQLSNTVQFKRGYFKKGLYYVGSQGLEGKTCQHKYSFTAYGDYNYLKSTDGT